MPPLTRLASETSLTGAPQKQDSKIRLGGQAADPPGRGSFLSVGSAQRMCRSKAGGLPSREVFLDSLCLSLPKPQGEATGSLLVGGVVVSSSRLFSTSAAL